MKSTGSGCLKTVSSFTGKPHEGRLSWLVGLVLVAGIALSIAQQSLIVDEVFVSGDGGIKTLMAKQFADGEWHADLRLAADPWVKALWEEGYYPFGPPFVYERDGLRYIQYPLPFMALTSPFYEWFGYRGLTLIPLLGVWLLWISFVALLGCFRSSNTAIAVSLAGLIFSSFVTPYAAMYWEHTTALGFSFLGFAMLIYATGFKNTLFPSYFVAGAFLGIAVWFRPESAVFAVGVLLGVLVRGLAVRSWLSMAAGLAAAAAVFGVFNYSLFGSLTGVHGIQDLDQSLLHLPHIPVGEIALFFVSTLFILCSVFLVLIAYTLVGATRITSLRIDKDQVMLWVIAIVFTVGTLFIVPNKGGIQVGARYFLHVLPILFLLLALMWDRVSTLGDKGKLSIRVITFVFLVVGAQINTVQGTQAIASNYALRILPALDAVREETTGIIVVQHQWMAQELESAFETKSFFLASRPAALAQLAGRMRLLGRSRFTLIQWKGARESTIRFPGGQISLRLRGQFESYALFDASIGRPLLPVTEDTGGKTEDRPSLK